MLKFHTKMSPRILAIVIGTSGAQFSSADMFAAEIVNVSSVLFQEIPTVLTTGSCPTVIGNSVALSASGVAATTYREFDTHFLAFMPAIPHRLSSSLYNCMPSCTVSTLSIESSMLVDLSTVSATNGYTSWCLLAFS